MHVEACKSVVAAGGHVNSDGATCEELPHYYFDVDTDPVLMEFMDTANAFLYGNEALWNSTEYVVSIAGEWKGAPFQKTWAFTTE